MSPPASEAGKMWGGRFQGRLDPFFEQFQRSLPEDHVLAFADLDVNRAWTRELAAAGFFSAAELRAVHDAIDDLAATWERDGVPADDPAEDVHSLVERELGRRCGDLAKRIHTGRSRNDQVATDLRMYLKERVFACMEGIRAVVTELVAKATAHAADPMPGYTHLQRAQPITIGHHALAHAEALGRDRERFADACARMDQCPLGSGALAGTALAIDRERLADVLEFADGPTRNSLDATAARDHVCELAFCAAMTMTHLSRLAADYIFFAAHETRFLRFDDTVATGSSLMPQKRNPDAMELIRGQAGRVQGSLQALLATVKSLPMAYNRDLQEDKANLLPALAQTEAALRVAALAVQGASFDVARCATEAERGHLNATDLADLLVAAGVPFRDAHEQVGRAVDRAVELGIELPDLPAADRQRLLPQLAGDLRRELSTERGLARRATIGGTSPDRVRAEAGRWRQRLADWQRDGGPGGGAA